MPDSAINELIQKKELAWEICRLNLKEQSEDNTTEEQVVPTWGAFNSVIGDEKQSDFYQLFLNL